LKITPLSLAGLIIFEPSVFHDDRGFFFESYRQDLFDQAVQKNIRFVQDNHSLSKKGVIRGLHYQLPPMAQGKLIRVVKGEILDVALDLRKSSPTFGRHIKEILNEVNKKMLWIPEGFAHGFLSLSNEAEILYKTTNFYSTDHERCVRFDDPSLKIDLPNESKKIISSKDLMGSMLSNAEVFP